MKFEEKFLSFQVPEWESHYLPYRQLKASLKLVEQKAHLSEYAAEVKGFHSSFSRDIAALGVFSKGHFLVLKSKEKAAFEPYGQVWSGSGFLGGSLADNLGLEDSRLIYAELLDDYTKLQWFNKLNYQASLRIYAKIEKVNKKLSYPSDEDAEAVLEEQICREKQCLKEMERLQALIDGLRRGNEKPQSPVQTTDISRHLIHFADKVPDALPYLITMGNYIHTDQASKLGDTLGKLRPVLSASPKPLLDGLFNDALALSIKCQAWSCAKTVVMDRSEREFWVTHHWLNSLLGVIHLTCQHNYNSLNRDNSPTNSDLIPERIGMELFKLMVDNAGIRTKDVLLMPDAAGMTPLHYSAQYGLTKICEIIPQALQRWNTLPGEAILATDSTDLTPLHWSVIRGHIQITHIFLTALDENACATAKDENEHLSGILNELLFIALKNQNDDLVQLLASSRININYLSHNGETCLHLASRIGRKDYVDILLTVASCQNADIDVQEIAYGWTPLFTASARGHLPIVEALLRAGANEHLVDSRGWTAREHAAFRGHFTTAERLKTNKITVNTVNGPNGVTSKYTTQPNTMYLVINLGTVQQGRQVQPLDLRLPPRESCRGLIDTTMSLEISTSTENSPTHTLVLPLIGDSIDDTFVFPIDDPLETHIVFRLLQSTSSDSTNGTLIGSGVSLLQSNSNAFSSHRESLIREQSVPILGKETMKLLGIVTFTSFMATPFPHLNTPTSSFEYLEKLQPAHLIGHRDVQLTRDLVPVLYHDLSLSESGTDVAIHDLTLKQFMHASSMQSSPEDNSNHNRARSRSLTRSQEERVIESRDRMKHTLYFSSKGFKPNTRGDFIQTSLATLEEALREVPETVGFDIELKYPRIHEASAVEIAPVAIDLNTFVDTILTLISRYANSRNIIISSFTPEICILLAIKQKAYPIFFITNAGKLPVADREQRAGSLQIAVRFATQWGLSGVVFASDVLVMCPQLVGYVKGKGLVCASYGNLNNIPESVELQAKAGVDLIVADRVGLISKTLKSLS
ncbi:hypothetical protein FQN49_000185 [Arthroderma sp. PD_2]|nr:hypothetical protein FQN49_000185 [Arthroderma sp. PD_2]